MTNTTYTRHPLSACFGDMDSEEFQAFKDDIEAHGQHEPILLFEGMILDGWHRYLAASQLGLDIQKFTFTGTFEEAQERVVSSNDKRKHRTVAQRAQAIVAVHSCRPVGRPAKNNSAPGAELPAGPTKGSAKQIATAHGIGTRSVERARVVQAAGLGPLVMDGALTGKEAEAIATGKAEEAAQVARGQPAVTPKPTAAPKRAPLEKTPAPTDAPTNADEAFDGFDPIAELEATQKRLEEAEKRIESMAADDTKAELNKQIGIRQGIEARLSLEMKKVSELQRELDSYGKWYADLRKVSGLEKRSEITRLVREAANSRSAAV